MAKAANGQADDLASTTLLATDKKVLMAPAMNVRMWLHAATRRNLATLQADGMLFVGPDEGPMACGEFGPGRMAEPETIFDAIQAALNGPAARPLAGKHALITAGPTVEPIDPVRFLSNRSSGKQGYAIAEALARLGAEATLISGPTALPTPAGVTRVDVETAQQMLTACEAALPADVAVMVAAVADWRPAEIASRKFKKKWGAAPEPITLLENPDILAILSRPGPLRPRLVIGFAAETNDLDHNSQAKLARKGCDWVVANDVSQPGVMGGRENAVSILTRDGIERWDQADKRIIAERLAARIAESLQ
jgi:phosphopantothenoylcysteine decarboxylase/phosphopantothenate--cysteine ligase